MLRLTIVVLLSFFIGVLVSALAAFIERGKGGFSSQTVLLLLGLFAIGLALIFTCPRPKRLHLTLAGLAFAVFGFLMASEPIFLQGTGSCSPASFAVCSVGLALVFTYGGKKPSSAKVSAPSQADGPIA